MEFAADESCVIVASCVLAGEDEFALKTAWLLNLEAAIEREPGCFGRPGSVKAKELFPHEAAHEFLARNQTRSTRPTAAGRAIMSKRIVTAVIVLLVASIGGYAAFLAKKAARESAWAGLDRSRVALPCRPMGRRVGFSMQGGRLRD